MLIYVIPSKDWLYEVAPVQISKIWDGSAYETIK